MKDNHPQSGDFADACHMMWEYAQNVASDLGGHLVSITTEEENNYIRY